MIGHIVLFKFESVIIYEGKSVDIAMSIFKIYDMMMINHFLVATILVNKKYKEIMAINIEFILLQKNKCSSFFVLQINKNM